jgi:Uma2 family endonuclease
MSIAEIERTYTPEELLAMPDAVNYELVDGDLVERNMSVLSSFVEVRVGRFLGAYCDDNHLGAVFSSSLGFRCFGDERNKIRKPDVSFISTDRFHSELLSEGYCPIAPDLAVEVISPGDLAREVTEKIEEYLTAGVSLIWIVEPEARIVDIYQLDGPIKRLRENDILDGESVLPGFRCPVKNLFPEKTAEKTQ